MFIKVYTRHIQLHLPTSGEFFIYNSAYKLFLTRCQWNGNGILIFCSALAHFASVKHLNHCRYKKRAAFCHLCSIDSKSYEIRAKKSRIKTFVEIEFIPHKKSSNSCCNLPNEKVWYLRRQHFEILTSQMTVYNNYPKRDLFIVDPIRIFVTKRSRMTTMRDLREASTNL